MLFIIIIFFISPARSQTEGCILANRHHVFAVCFLEAGFTEPLAGWKAVCTEQTTSVVSGFH